MTPKGCEHFQVFKEDSTNLETLRWIHAVFVVGTASRFRQVKICNSFCHTCRNRGPFLHACVECVYFGCHEHIRHHTRDQQHNFSIELNYGQLHCTKCGDYIHDSELDNIALKNRMQSKKFHKRLFECVSWVPSEEEQQLLSNQAKKVCITSETTIGLRGLFNLGSTCFMNCIVQALMHTPLLRDYFLTEQHYCPKRVQGACSVCEVSKLFQKFYNGDRSPLALHELLHLIWTHATHLCGDKQHDAHEFFMAALDLLHKHYSESTVQQNKNANHNNSGNCTCIIHQIFTGGLQSDVVCQSCHGVSTTTDPTWDFALDLVSVTEGGRSPCSLIDCLESFTKAEHLGIEKIMCENCGSKQEITKQLTIKTLPVVATFQLKRFSDADVKISTAISFPEMIDMTPFMSKNKNEKIFPTDNRYSLFAVINHSGDSADKGHFIAFVRQHYDYWYKCNDEIITPVTLKDVLASEGYILFYHKHVLGYE